MGYYDYYYDYGFLNAIIGVLIGFAAIFAVIGLALWIIGSLGLMKMAQNRGIENAGLAWIPIVGHPLILGRLVPEISLFGGTVSQLHVVLPVAVGVLAVLSGPIAMIPVLGALVVFAASILYAIIYFVTLYNLYKSYRPSSATLFLVLSIIFQFMPGIFWFVMRNDRPAYIPAAPAPGTPVWRSANSYRQQGYGYGAPQQPNYGAPQQPNYGAPQQPNYGAPQQPNYGAPQQPNYGAPQQPNYGAPQQPNYGAPQQPNYGAPQQPNYGAPQQPNYGAPQQPNYGAPQQPNYEAPQRPNNGAPQQPGNEAPQQGETSGENSQDNSNGQNP